MFARSNVGLQKMLGDEYQPPTNDIKIYKHETETDFPFLHKREFLCGRFSLRLESKAYVCDVFGFIAGNDTIIISCCMIYLRMVTK